MKVLRPCSRCGALVRFFIPDEVYAEMGLDERDRVVGFCAECEQQNQLDYDAMLAEMEKEEA